MFVGYPLEIKEYYFYLSIDKQFFVARKGHFLEEDFLYKEMNKELENLRIYQRARYEPDRYYGFVLDIVDLSELVTYHEVVSGKKELDDFPPKGKSVGSEWVFKKKIDMDGNMQTYKAGLVVKGFTKTHGIDYDETFSPIVMLKSIRIMIFISAYFNYEISHMDVKIAFHNGNLTKDVFMAQLDGFLNPKNPNKFYKFLKSIYGLKQASRS
ncbi:putative RNA-directed DNA polymerase [Tanacetum coccineum]